MSDGRDHRWSDDEDEIEGDGAARGGGRVPDFVRKALMTGIGAVFTTEEGVRNAMGENMKLPKEAMQYLAGQVDRTKRDIVQTLARELRTFLDGLEVDDLARRALSGTTFEIHTTIRVTADESGKLDVENSDTKFERKKDDVDDAAEKKKKAKKAKAEKSADAAADKKKKAAKKKASAKAKKEAKDD